VSEEIEERRKEKCGTKRDEEQGKKARRQGYDAEMIQSGRTSRE
jgi:hypothetical protein